MKLDFETKRAFIFVAAFMALLLSSCGDSDTTSTRGLFAPDLGNGSSLTGNESNTPSCLATVYQSNVAVGDNFTLIVDAYGMTAPLQVADESGMASRLALKTLSTSRIALLYRLEGESQGSVQVTDSQGRSASCDYFINIVTY